MTQFVDFVALGWVEQNLRGEIEAARKCLYHYQREPNKPAHLKEAERNIHSATSALRLCTLEPAALVNEVFIRLLDQRTPFDNRRHFLAIASTLMLRVIAKPRPLLPSSWLRA